MVKRKFNALDAIIIAVLLVTIACAAVLYFTKSETQASAEKTKIEFDILAINLTEQEAQSIKSQEGTEIVFGKTNSDRGLMKNVKVEPYRRLGRDMLQGEYTWIIQPALYQAIITVQKDVTETEDLFKGDKEEIRIGELMPFLGKGFGVSGSYVSDLREVAE